MSPQISRVLKEIHPKIFTWTVEELKKFREHISKCYVDSFRSYSKSYRELEDSWYAYLHQRLTENDFQNGKPEENSIEKRPKAHFWWAIYSTSPANYRPFYDHHCSSLERQEQMLNLLDDLVTQCVARSVENS